MRETIYATYAGVLTPDDGSAPVHIVAATDDLPEDGASFNGRALCRTSAEGRPWWPTSERVTCSPCLVYQGESAS